MVLIKNKIKERSSKHIKVISLITGFAYAGVSALVILIVFLQKLMLASFNNGPSEVLVKFNEIHLIFLIYFPMVLVLGVAYILFGFRFKELKLNIYKVSLVLRVVSIILPIVYLIHILTVIPEFNNGMDHAPLIFYIVQFIFGIFGLLVLLAAFSLPQYFIHRKVKIYVEASKE